MNFLRVFFQKSKNKSARNALWIVFERFISVGVTTLVTILSARFLGAEDFGILSYGLTLTTLFFAVMSLGIDSIIVNELIKDREKEGELLGTSIFLRLISSFLSITLMALTLHFLNPGEETLILVSVTQSFILSFQAIQILDYWFQSHLRSKYVSISKMAATLAASSYSAYLLITGKSVLWFAASTVINGMLIAILLLIFYKRQQGQPLTFSRITAKKLLNKSHHFIIANLMTLIYVQIDKVMIGNILDQKQLGLYSAALMICSAWIFLPTALITSLRPTILSARISSVSIYLSKLKQLYFLLFWLCIFICGIFTLFAPILVPVLFGPEFAPSTPVLQIAIWAVPLSVLGTARSIWIVGEDKGKYVKYLFFMGAIVNIGLNFLLIPTIGIIGAAISSIITELFTCLVAPLVFKSTRIHSKILLEALIPPFKKS